MRATSVTVADLKKKAQAYENERIEVTVELDPGETAEDGITAARMAIARIRGEMPTHEELRDTIEGVEAGAKDAISELRRMMKVKRI